MTKAPESTTSQLAQLHDLLVAAKLWSAGLMTDVRAVAPVRAAALLGNHRRYLEHVPAYAAMAHDRGLSAGADLAAVKAELLVSDEWFKSYDRSWLSDDLDALTRWIGTIAVPKPHWSSATSDLDGWRAELRQQRVFLTFSSGTTGQPSIVPRDETGLAALRHNSGVRLPWTLPAGGFDCLLMTPCGQGTGIQAGASGLAAAAVRVHHLHPTHVHLDAMSRARPAQSSGPAADLDPDSAADHDAAVAFLREGLGQRPMLIYGPPQALGELVAHLQTQHIVLPLSDGSCIVTGGGWKSATPGDLDDLFEHARERLGVVAERCLDTYAAAEMNTVFVRCVQRRYHVPPVVEALVLDDLLQPVPDPEAAGRLAILDPFAVSYPGFVATGDRVQLSSEPCPCGLVGQTLIGPVTRMSGAALRGCGVTDQPVRR